MKPSVPTYDLYGEERGEAANFQLHCETIAARSSTYHWEIGLHRHENFLQFLYIRNGSGDAILGDAVVQLRPPCVVYIPPGPTHGFRFSRDIAGLVVTATARQPLAFMTERHPRVIALEPDDPDAIYLGETFNRIAAEYDAGRPGRSELLDAYLAVVGSLVHRHSAQEASQATADPAQRHIAAFRELIGRHFRQQMPAVDYAALLNLSPTHLNRIVYRQTGLTAHAMIMARSVEEAKRALALTGATIQQISENLGFSDPAYFSRCFRRETGMTPREYRRGQRQDFP